MPETVGVVDPFTFVDNESIHLSQLKRQALMFDRLAIPNLLDTLIPHANKKELLDIVAEIEWLLEQGVIFDPKLEHHDNPSEELKSAFGSLIYYAKDITSQFLGINMDKLFDKEEPSDEFMEQLDKLPERTRDEIVASINTEKFRNTVLMLTVHSVRVYSIQFRELHGIDAYPLLSITIPPAIDAAATKSDILRIALNYLPIPDETTHWEQILEFRNDPDSRHKFLDLRNWVNEVARGELSRNEIEDKLAYLISQYQRRMEVHKMKINKGVLETIVVSTIGLMKDLTTFNWKTAAQMPFTFSQRRIAMLEGELNTLGSEVAYILKARENF